MKNLISTSISRRGFIKSGAGVAGIAAMTSLVGCSGSDSGSTTTSDKKKIIRFGQKNAKQGLDMQKSTNSSSSSVADSIVEAPLKWTEDLELVPCLFTEVPTPEDDGVTYKCVLKEGVKFHNDAVLTATDVKYSFERMFKPATAAKSTYMYDMIVGAKDMLAGTATELSGLTIQDDTHLTFVLEYPMATFAKNLGINYADIFPHEACEAAGDDWGKGTDIIGTGPYKMKENDDTTEVVLERFDDYHDGTPNLDTIEYYYVDDINTKLLNFKNGDLDYCDLDATLLQQYQQDADVKDLITQYLPLGVEFINLNLNDPALSDVRVRQALSLAIDRQELIDTVLSGAGQAASGWLNPQTPGYDDTAEAFPYDVDKAKSLLAEAGVSDLSLTASVRVGLDQKIMVAVQGYWSAIGVNLAVNTSDAGVWASDWAAGNLQITALAWFPLYADGDNHMYTYFYSENAAKKSSFYNSPEFDALVVKARQSTDESERADLYKQADNLLTRTDFATLPLYYPKYQFVAKDYVENAKVGNLIYHMMDLDVDTSKSDYTTEA